MERMIPTLHPDECVVECDGQRAYRIPELGVVPSVSTILRETDIYSHALRRWREKLGSEGAELVSQIARERGRKLHRQIELFMRDDVAPPADDRWWASIAMTASHLRITSELLWVERTVWHPLDFYAGTPDWLGRILGALHLIDLKSATAPLGKSAIARHAEQLAGYADAIAMWGERPENGTIIVALPDRPAQVVRVRLADALETWRERVQAFHKRGAA